MQESQKSVPYLCLYVFFSRLFWFFCCDPLHDNQNVQKVPFLWSLTGQAPMAPASWITCLAPVISTATSTPRGYISRMVRERSSTSWTRATDLRMTAAQTKCFAGARNDIQGFNMFQRFILQTQVLEMLKSKSQLKDELT